ncbi:MAG: NACHT domain-containing protein, partial [Cyanobacteria bacterium P01_A01_bin.84]
MSQEQQEDEKKRVIDTTNLTQEKEEDSEPNSSNIEIGDIKDSNGVAIGDGAMAQITNNYYGFESPDEKLPALTLDNWYKVCHGRIEKQKQTRLTTNSLTYRDEVSFALNDVYVPIELVEQKQRPKHSNNILAEESSSLYLLKEESITDNTFLEKVIYQEKSEKSKELRIAIIGEPGSGKTTLLQKIADWLLNTKKEIVIWVSLSDLQTRNLEDYLKEVWLKAALPDISPKLANVNEAVQNALAQLFNSNLVWLLLDGVDEMNAGGEHPLSAIANNLNSWVGKARVILSCRLNVWDIEKNALEEFKTYRTLEFSYDNTPTSNQIHKFISNWFKNISLERGKLLETLLNQPGKERLKDLVRNPLRLALLCRIWQSEEGHLPETKVKLYSQYVEEIYSWKQEILDQAINQEQLNQALGELAKRGIESGESRFRLREKLVREVLEPELFNLALNIGWLNRVGETTEKPKEDVYAFLHGTFQEYFAAQRITDWRFFINYESDNIQPIKFPIFAPRWKEVILLWLQQSETKESELQKLEFIEALAKFQDKYHGDNIFKTSTFLIAECLVEADFRKHRLYKVFYKKIVRIYRHSPYKLLQEQGFKILKKFEYTVLFSFLKEELKSNKKNRYLKAVETLGEIGTEEAIELLANQYLKEGEEPTAIVNALMVKKCDIANEKLEEIIKQLGEDEEESLISGIINQLVNANRQDYINLLIKILQNSQTPQWMQSVILQHLGSVNHLRVNDIFIKNIEQ